MFVRIRRYAGLQTAILALVQIHQERIAAFEARVTDLEARLKLNSTNSHKPPSSDYIGAKRKPPAPPTGKKRGGQPKPRKAHRVLVPPENVHETFTCKPTHCRHLRRDFQAMIDHGGEGKPIGETLLKRSHRLFHHWHRVRDGPLDWERFGSRMAPLKRQVHQALEAGSKCGCAKTAATCLEILKVEEGLWAFTRVQGVEPTNNAAERALRFAVIWRRISGGTDSERGSRFVERTLSVVATCRQQGRNVLDYLSSCLEAEHRGQTIPSLLPTSRKSTPPDFTSPTL